ncbi:CRISPR-associated endonuclease Cas2 [Candidatus Parcubacteria bacterium]|nr:CRISPR-associated endonuclease Cas2 [Candidatus Parcubacteria bacterium]
MKIPLTDKFLWDLYSVFEELGKIAEPHEIFTVRSWRDVCNPDSFKFWREYERKRSKRQFGQFINYLKKKGYIKIKNLEEGRGILLTVKGKQKALTVEYKLNPKFKSKLKKRKDKKWIMVIFDIPEKKRKYRDNFRKFLYNLGFQKLQRSIWISPYEVSKDLEKIIRAFLLDKFVKIFLIKEIEI